MIDFPVMLRRVLLFFLLFLLAACSAMPGNPAGQSAPQPDNPANPSELPDPQAVARAYLDAWKAGDYLTMYNLLTSISQAALSQEEFIRHYQGVAEEASMQGVDYEILAALYGPEQAQVSYRVKMDSSLVGKFQADTEMNLSLEHNQWRVQWDDGLVLPQLKGSNYLAME